MLDGHEARAKLTALARNESHPLAKISSARLEEFNNGLIFRDGHLAHADFTGLAEDLNDTEIQLVFAELGVAPETFGAHKHSECYRDEFCATKPNAFCDPEYCRPD